MSTEPEARITEVSTGVYRFPTPEPEADGTLTWDSATAVTVQITAGGKQGLGWTYSTPAAAQVIDDHLTPAITGLDPADIDDAGQRCTGPAGTWAPGAWSCRPSAPSTSPCGISRPASSAFR